MSLSNEQRAHDLALLTIQCELSGQTISPFTSETDNKVNPVTIKKVQDMYMDAYLSCLSYFDKTFPFRED